MSEDEHGHEGGHDHGKKHEGHDHDHAHKHEGHDHDHAHKHGQTHEGHDHGHGQKHENDRGQEHGHRHGHAHNHGNAHDRGITGLVRYLRLLPKMWHSPVSDEVVRSLAPAPGERAVDLGAGMGAATVVAARSGTTVLAVDPTPYMRQILGLRRLWQRSRSGITVMEGAAESIPVAEASIDALWTVNTIHHWTDRRAAAHELARVMRPGGRMLLVDEDFDDPAHPAYAEMKAHWGHASHHFDEVDPVSVATALIQAGFATATGSRSTLAGRPAKVIRATR